MSSVKPTADIDKYLDLLRDKDKQALAGGGAERIEKLHTAGKMTARERILAFVDEGSFEEFDRFKKHRCTDFD
ncbi:MAG TPA: carboxyl transferase domain-containing protein, partial [Acidobacteriota bacterium]|nr:carboxyl transferase domain-containing protein [Acidobacteriota bacterium]